VPLFSSRVILEISLDTVKKMFFKPSRVTEYQVHTDLSVTLSFTTEIELVFAAYRKL